MSVDLLQETIRLIRERARAATPGPWRDSTVDGNRFAALVADQPHPDRLNPDKGGWGWDAGYGGWLVGESLMAADRAHIASLHPLVALAAADLLEGVHCSLGCGPDGMRDPYCSLCEDSTCDHECPPPVPCEHTGAMRAALAFARAYLGRDS